LFNLKFALMKTKIILLACIIAVILFTSTTIGKTFDYKVKIVPQTYSSLTNPNALERTAEVINRRLINYFAIHQENIKLEVAETHIMLTLHNIDSGQVNMIKNVISTSNKLEFWETYENSEVIGYLTRADSLLHALRNPGRNIKAEKKPHTGLTGKSTVSKPVADSRVQFSDGHPLFSILGPGITTAGDPLPSCMIGLADGKDTAMVNTYLKMDTVKALFPDDLEFYWDSNPYSYDPSKTMYGLHAIKVTTGNRCAPIDGSTIISAEVTIGSDKHDVRISLTMDPEGARTWAELTRKNISRCVAIVYNGYVRSYPRVQSEITGGLTEITGDFTTEEANDLVNSLNSGQLPFEIKITEEQLILKE